MKTDKLPKNDLTDKRFGRLTVKSYGGKINGRSSWNCVCDCGGKKKILAQNLKGGITTSCGCYNREIVKQKRTTHGQTKGYKRSAEYQIYNDAKARCNNPKNKSYNFYGGRGVEFRFKSFDEFIEHLGKRPSKNFTLDRIENNGHYECGNVRWATRKQQSNNTRRNRFIEIDGVSKTISAWSELSGVPVSTISLRLDRSGFCNFCAVNAPIQKGKRQICVHG